MEQATVETKSVRTGLTPPDHRYVFEIKFSNGDSKQVTVFDWNRGGAWATLCRDVNKQDHGDSRQIESMSLRATSGV